jgi:hypothetical protein
MTTAARPVRSVCSLIGPARPGARIDLALIEDYILTGARRPDLPTEARFTASPGGFPDAVDLYDLPGLLISTRLREVLDTAAPGDLEHHPITVEGREFWLTRIATVIDALDRKASFVRYGPDKQLKLGSRTRDLIWKSDTLTRPAVFRIPGVRNWILITDTVAAAVLRSGCIGIRLHGPKGTIR